MSKLFECNNCGSNDYIISMSGNNTGLYCAKCHKWKKWLNKTEVKLFSEDSQKQNVKQVTNADVIRNMSDEESKDFLCDISNSDCSSCLATDYCRFGHTGFITWLKLESEE